MLYISSFEMLNSWIYVCLFGLLAGVGSSGAPEGTKFSGIIYNGKTPVCIGAIVAAEKKLTMITAAHCLRGASNLVLSLGNISASIKNVIIHPFYKPPSYDYDIAVLKTELIDAKNLERILLPDSETNIPKTLKVTSKNLEEIQVTKEERQACQSKHGSKIRISTKMICVQSESNVLGGSALFFEKGSTSGKAAKEYILLGVASYGLNSSLPLIFTNIANPQIYKFIDQYI